MSLVIAFVVALILCGIICLVAWGFATILPAPPVVKTIVWVVAGVFCLLILLAAVTGNLGFATVGLR